MLSKESKKRLACWMTRYLLSGVFSVTGALSAFGQPVDVINIASPNKDGISVNQSVSFSVTPKGVVLNNATVNTKTNLAGMVAANANLKGKAATVILQEVTGKEQSQLTGTLEIAGTPADFILANPNGIYADGARFVNANQVSLWAGTPVYQNGNLMREKVKLGANGIQVGRSGLRIGEKSKLQLAARTLSLEGDVKAGQIEVFASTGTLNLQRSSTLKKAEKPRERLVDIAETGGMYANSIYIQAMESGTAVQNKGTLQASQKLHITANGDIVLRGAMQAPEVKVRAANNVDVIRKQAAQEVELPLMESKDIKLAENGAAVWNIENANWLGISINRTDALYVGKKGLVLNNAVKPYRTQTAGLVQPNANLQGEPAELIVCEGSKDEGLIRGNIEIAGPRTDLLLASPAGLTIYGGKAINIGELTLVTGSCRFIQGVPLLRMNPSGMLVLGEKGLDGDNTDSITLSTKYLYHGAGIKTPSLNMVMGGSSLPMKFMETKKPAGMSALYMEYFTPGSARSYTVGKGIPELDVAAPDEQGISVNELGEFQVKKNGYIFNNALQETETQLAGKIEKNMNLWLNPARLIVGQAAKSTSHIQGDIEIAGERASLLLANPKGFVLDGGKVINANRVTFLAGTATRTGQEFSLLPQTSVEVKKGGLVTIDSVQTNFIGNKVKIGGTLTASNLNVIAGSGKTNYSDLRTSQATDKKEEFLEITGDGKIKAENLSLVAAGTNTGLIQNGKIETNRRFTATMTGNILLNGYTGVGIGEIRTGKNIANNGYLNGEILYLKGNHIINKGSVFGADVNLAFADLENSGTVIKDPLPPAEDFDTKIKAADAQLKKAKNTLQEFVEENGPILYNPDLTEIFVELKEEVVKAEKELEKAEKAKADYLQKKGSTTDQQETGSVIYGSRNVALAGNRVYNRPNAVIYSDGLLRIHGKTDKEKADLVHNNGASLYGKDRIAIAAKQLQNTNASLKLKTIDGKWENDPDRIEIDAPGSDYNHVIATKKYFEDLNGRHSYRYVPHPDERGKYETISREQLKEYLEENPFTEDMEFDEFNAWENDHEETTEFLKGLGINTDAAETWSESQIIEKVEEALLKKYGKNLDDYNKMAEEYNKVLTFHNYWEIHSKHKNINTNLLQSLPGQIISDGNMKLEGTVTNKDSLFNAADRLEITGILKNTATAVEKRVVHDGTVQHAAPEQHWHHFHNKTERRWTAAEPYKEPDDVMKYYLPTVSYTVDSKNPANLSALTEGERKALEHGRYRVDEVIRGQRKFLGFIIDKDQGLQEKMASSLLSARELVLTGEAGSVNEGTLLGNTVTVGGKEFTNKGIIEAKDVTMKAEGMFRNSGDITAEKKLIAEAKNVQITREPVAARERDWKKDEPGGMVVTGKDALLYLGAKEELLLKNQRLAATGKGGRIVADAQRDITLEVDTQTKTIGTTQSENNIRTLTTDSGSMMDAMGDISLQAGRNINIKASSVWSGEGKVTLLAGNDINVTTGKNLMDSHYYWRHKNGGMGSKRGTFTEDQKAYEKDPISTEIFGKSVKLAAKRDVNLLSSNSITRDNTLIKAGRDITSAVDTSLKKTEYTRTFTGSGIRSGGFFGIQIGRWSETHTSASESTQPVPTTITSTHGKVDLDAEGRIHATTTYIYGKDGVTLSGADILLDGSQAKHKYSQTDAYRFKGLSAGLGGRAMKKLHDAYVFSGNALRARDKRLAVLEGLEAGKSWKEAKDYWNQEGKKGLTISVALTQEKQQQKYDSIIVRYEGGKIGSDKEIVLRVADLKNGQVKLIGQTLSGKEIRLETYKVDLEAGKNTTESHSENQSSGGHVGADIGSHSFTPDIGFNAARGKSTEQSESWTPTLLNGNLVSIEAGGDLHIDGSFVMGKKVDVNVGGDLKISSRQNSYTYHAKNSAIGGGVSLKSGGGSLSKDRTEYSLQTVAEQAGIFAGKEGLKVNVKGKTTLLGAVLDSQAEKEKNRVTTGDLELKDMDNIASLSNKGGGAGYQTGQDTKRNEQGLTPMLVVGVDRKTKSKTYAAIVEGKLEITGNKKVKVEDINRNTQHTLNALENTLNLRKLEERKRLSTLFAKHANEAIHVLSETNHWKEGSPEKVFLHAFVGGMTAQMGGDTALAGAIPGAVNEIFSGALQRYEAKHGPLSPDQRQWLAAAGGAIANYATGQTLQTGGAVAAYGTKWNEFKERNDWKSAKDAEAEMSKATNEELEETRKNVIRKQLTDFKNDLQGTSLLDASAEGLSYLGSVVLGSSNKNFAPAVELYQYAVMGSGKERIFDKDSKISQELITAKAFRERIKKESEKLSSGNKKVITFSESIGDTTPQKVAFGKVKFAVEISKGEDGHVHVSGKAADVYDFTYLDIADKDPIYGKDWMIKTANNIAHHLLYKGCLNPYVWEAQITWDFKAEK